MTSPNGHGPNGHTPGPGVPPQHTARQPPPQQPQQPPMGVPPVQVLARQFEELVQQNSAEFAKLQAAGINIDPISIIHARIDHLIDMIAAAVGPQGPQWAALVRLQFEQKMTENIANARDQGRQQQLSIGGRLSPGEISAMAKQSGQYGFMFKK